MATSQRKGYGTQSNRQPKLGPVVSLPGAHMHVAHMGVYRHRSDSNEIQ